MQGPTVTKDEFGNIHYRLNGVLHREDGPAVIETDGSEIWYLNGSYHREDGPAFTSSTGTKVWYVNGVCHRIDGPAILRNSGFNGWYIKGQQYGSNKTFQVAAEISDEDMFALFLKYGDITWY